MSGNSIKKPLVSLIIPCFNEETNILNTYQTIQDFWNQNLAKDYALEIVMVDDGSTDTTAKEIEKLAQKNSNLKFIQFSRNFGKEIATTAGIEVCTGDCAIMFDADLQYPINKLPEFLQKWASGSEVVVGLRDRKKTRNLIEKIGSFAFYKIIKLISEVQIESGALDYRLIDRVVISEFTRFTERGRMTRALIDWLGFTRSYVCYAENDRASGTASYSFAKRVKLALSTFVATSLLPLKLAGYLGVLICLVSGLLGLFILITRYLLGDPFGLSITGSAAIGIMVVFLTGVNLMSLGLIALYIANIHTEVSNRPLYVIKKKVGF